MYPNCYTEIVTCTACNGRFEANVIVTGRDDRGHFVKSCPHCGSVQAERISEKVAYLVVSGEWSNLPEDHEQIRHFDMTFIEEATGKLARRHGWYDVRNNKIVQVG